MIILADRRTPGFDAGSAEFDQVFMFMVALHVISPLHDVMAMTAKA